MCLHANAKLGLAGRAALVGVIERGTSLRGAAARFNVSPATAHRWWHRWLEGGRQLSALLDRSSRPRRSPRLLSAELQERICDCRRRTGWGPRLVAGATGFAHSTVWKVLRRHGLSRRPVAAREPANRYEWPCPGDLLHMDVCSYARFLRPGHRVTGDRSQRLRGRSVESRVGYDYAHAIVDDHSRLAYVELHDDEKAATVTGFVERALAFFAAHGITCKRLMTDNAFAYVKNRSLREPRPQLPLTSTTQPGPATLARPLQPDQTAQRARRTATNQPRSQHPWVGQLVRPAAPARAACSPRLRATAARTRSARRAGGSRTRSGRRAPR
jgi:transposase